MNKRLSALCAVAALALAACTPPAPPAPDGTPSSTAPAEAAAPGINISEPWAAATPGGARVAAGYMTMRNNSDIADALVSIASPRAPRVELHEMRMNGDMMVMRPVQALAIPANGAVSLAPGGYHLMFIDIPAPFAVGESVPLTLTFEKAGTVEVTLPVQRRAEPSEGAHGQH